ncbi:hypothetical protein Tco_0833036 [Tanacetum coccineum]
MVACLEKSAENVEFHQIVDFLSTCSINYVLTAVAISESSVRSDLLFNDEDGITCLTNDEIFENLALMGYEQLSTKLTFQKGSLSPQLKFLIHTILHCISSKSTAWNEFSTNLASAVICLADGGSPRRQDTMGALLLRLGGNILGSDEGRMELIKELMETCTSLTKRVLALEKAKTAQDKVINRLKLRVKRLDKKRKARTLQPIKRRLFKGKVETSTDISLGEDASKQGRSSDKTKPRFKDSDFDVLDAEKITTTGPLHVSTADQVSTARPEVSAATTSTPPTTTTVFDDEDVTMAMA